MKKRKLLVALMLCTTLALQANANDVSDWKGVTNAFMNRDDGSNYTLINDVTVPKYEDIEGYSIYHDDNNAHFEYNTPLNFDLGGYTISGESLSDGDYHAIFEIGKPQYGGGEQDYSEDANLRIYNGIISNIKGDKLNQGVIHVENSQNIKELNVDFDNNSNYAGGAIANITGINQPQSTYVSSVIESVSGNFTNNKANYGGAIYNSGENYLYSTTVDNGSIEYNPISDVSTIDLNTVLTLQQVERIQYLKVIAQKLPVVRFLMPVL